MSPYFSPFILHSDSVPTITQFGIYGDGIERVTKYTYTTGINVLCSSSTPNTTVYWQFANGSRIGISNRSFRAGHFQNGTYISVRFVEIIRVWGDMDILFKCSYHSIDAGTAVLQIGTALLYTRSLTLCDGGVYTCVATGHDGNVQLKNFSLIIGCKYSIVILSHNIRISIYTYCDYMGRPRAPYHPIPILSLSYEACHITNIQLSITEMFEWLHHSSTCASCKGKLALEKVP